MAPAKKKYGRWGNCLLPDLFTPAALFAGFYSIVATVDGNFQNGRCSDFCRDFAVTVSRGSNWDAAFRLLV